MRQRLARFLGMTFRLQLRTLMQPVIEFPPWKTTPDIIVAPWVPRWRRTGRGLGSAGLHCFVAGNGGLHPEKEYRQPALPRRAESMTPSTQFP